MLPVHQLYRYVLAVAFLLAAHGGPALADGKLATDTARFLAGMQPSADGQLAKLAQDGYWQQHAKSFDETWKSLDTRQLSKVRAWSQANLTNQQPVLFYMFSGPDFLYADSFFSNSSTIVMSGLEPAGAIPDVTKLAPRAVPGELANIRNSLSTVLNLSFFITRSMSYQLRSHQLSGTLPVIYVFLARTGKTIKDASLVGIDKDGVVHPEGAAKAPLTARGAKIIFAGADGKERTLYYFQTDLSDGGAKNSGFLKFCEGLGKGDALVKSASYLLHNAGFTTVRDFLLKNTASIVQDDTGVPVRFFDEKQWQLKPFGRYLPPIPIFAGQYQPQMAELFKKTAPGKLEFGIGYRSQAPESNLLLAVRAPEKSAQTQ